VSCGIAWNSLKARCRHRRARRPRLQTVGRPEGRQATRRRVTMGRCLRPPSNVTTSSSRTPGLPLTNVGGAAHGEPLGHLDRGSKRGERWPGLRAKCLSSGVGPFRRVCGLCSSYQVAQQRTCWRNVPRQSDRGRLPRPSSLRDRMNRSTTVMLPCLPTAPNRGRMPRRLHHLL